MKKTLLDTEKLTVNKLENHFKDKYIYLGKRIVIEYSRYSDNYYYSLYVDGSFYNKVKELYKLASLLEFYNMNKQKLGA